MPHTPFIVASYVISAVLLAWAAFAPVVNKRTLFKQLKNRQRRLEE